MGKRDRKYAKLDAGKIAKVEHRLKALMESFFDDILHELKEMREENRHHYELTRAVYLSEMGTDQTPYMPR